MLINGKLINFRALLVRWEIAFYGPLLVFAPFTLQAAILADTVSWNVIGREVQIFNPHFSSVGGEGQGEGIIHGNSAIVTGGAFVGVAGNYHIQENDTSYCPGCIIQLYTAWIAPAPAGSQAFYNGGIPPGFGTQIGVIPNNFADSALYAPTEPGVYYIGFAFTLQYQIFPNRQGVFGTLPGGSVANYAPFRVTVIGESLPDNPQGNTLNLASGGGYGILSDYTNRGTLNNAGATLVVPGLTNFTNAGVFNNSGNVQIFGSFTNAGNLKISGGAMADGAIDELEPGGFVQMAGSTTITGGGTLSTNHLDLRTGDLNLVDGNLTVGHFDNQGNFNYSGGSFQGELNNLGTVNVSGSGTRIFNGNVTNQGTFKITDTQVQFNGTFTNSGAYISDPSTNQFNNLVVGPEGYLVGGSGDTFIITGDFLNASTQSTLWNTTKAELIFAESELGNSEHILQLAGEDRGAQAAGFLNNFAWGSLTLNPGQTLILQDGNNTAGAALYVRTINLPGGMAQLAGISGDYNIYFDPTVEANQAFLNGASFGSGSGQLLPWSFVPDLVETEGLTLDQQNFSAALDEACLNPSEALGLRCAELQSMTPEQKQQAIQSLTPDQVPNQAGIPVKFNSTRMDAVFTRLTGLRRGTTPAFSLNLNGLQFSKNLLLKANEDAGSPLRDSPLGMFIQSRFNIGGVNGNAFERGSDFETRNVTFGMDYRFTDNLVAGVAVNYTNTSSRYHWGAGSLDSDTFLGVKFRKIMNLLAKKMGMRHLPVFKSLNRGEMA